MTLKLVVSGGQHYKFVLVEDSVDEQAHLLFRSFVNEGLTNGKEVHVICFDRSPDDIESNLGLQKNKRLFFHDSFSDSAGWLKNQSCDWGDVNKNIFSAIPKTSSDCSGLLIVVDSLSSVIISNGFQEVYKQIHWLINHDTGTGVSSVKQLVGFIYPETLLFYDSVAVQLRHLATVLLTVINRKECMSERFCVKVQLKKANGKLLKQMEDCWLDSQSLLQSKKIEIAKEIVSKSECNEIPSQLTTFKLGLNEEEKVARSQLILPYLKTDNSGTSGGLIYYEPDENDDWDEEDPDDDLDV